MWRRPHRTRVRVRRRMTAEDLASTLQCFQKRDEVSDLIGRESKLGHVWMTRYDAFGQRLFQILHRVPLVQRPEGRSRLERALGDLVDRMTPRAVRPREIEAPLHARWLLCPARRSAGENGRRGDGENNQT